MDLSFQSPPKDRRLAFWSYTGSLLLAIILLITVHEFGHAIALRLRGYSSITIRINPFMGATSTSETIQMSDATFIALGGTIFNLSISLLIGLILHFVKNTAWNPLKIYSATSFLVEGMVIVGGMFFEQTFTDFAVLVFLGWSPVLVFILGMIFLVLGSYFMYEVWISMGIGEKSSRTWILVFNLPFIIYFGLGAAISLSLLPSEMDFIKPFLILIMVLQWLVLGIRIMLAPIIIPKIEALMPKDLPSIKKATCIFTLVLGVVSWIVGFLFWN